MDSSYARLLQQQQLFLQLQILSQQQQHYNYQTILPAPLKYAYAHHNHKLQVLTFVFFSSNLDWLASITLYLNTPESKPNIVVFNNPEGH